LLVTGVLQPLPKQQEGVRCSWHYSAAYLPGYRALSETGMRLACSDLPIALSQ